MAYKSDTMQLQATKFPQFMEGLTEEQLDFCDRAYFEAEIAGSQGDVIRLGYPPAMLVASFDTMEDIQDVIGDECYV